MKGYVVAVSQKEADEIVRDRPDLVHTQRKSAIVHLQDVQAPPTDSYYANQYRIYEVKPSEETRGGDEGMKRPPVYHSAWCDRMNGGFECNCEAGEIIAQGLDPATVTCRECGCQTTSQPHCEFCGERP